MSLIPLEEANFASLALWASLEPGFLDIELASTRSMEGYASQESSAEDFSVPEMYSERSYWGLL